MSNLLEAIFSCDLRALKSFINGSENVNCKIPGAEGCTILHIVAGMKKHEGKEELLSYLLEMGADPNARSTEDLTPVHLAAMWNNYSELEKLLQAEGDPWLVDNENKNAFDLAADHHSYESYEILNKHHSEKAVVDKSQNLSNNSTTYHSFFSFSDLLNVGEIFKKNKLENDSSFQNCRSLDDAVILSNSEDSFNITVLEIEETSGIALVEEDSLPTNFTKDSSFVANDWKSCSALSGLSNSELKVVNLEDDSINDPICGWTSCKSDFSFISSDSFANNYKELSNQEIFQELLKLGDMPGPISDYTRDLYLKRLIKIKNGAYVPVSSSEPKYCSEIQKFLSGELSMDKIQLLSNDISKEFNDSKTKTKWREGNQKCCFNYFLLDPRVTHNLPARHSQLTDQETFLNFINAIFYVGKGTKSRPYSHLLDAVKALADLHTRSDKINHILDIWNADFGVISLHCFNNCIPVEAYTQEACIIEALGLKNLSNVKSGDYYGQSSKWRKSLKRQVGILFLNKALQIYLNEGEKQIKAKDIKK